MHWAAPEVPILAAAVMMRKSRHYKMAVLLGGRASEHLVFEHFSTGAADDLAKATDIARSMVTRYGMDEALGHVVYEEDRPLYGGTVPSLTAHREISNETAARIDEAVRNLVQTAFDTATELLTAQREALERGAKLLLAQETLTGRDLEQLKLGLPIAAARNTLAAL